MYTVTNYIQTAASKLLNCILKYYSKKWSEDMTYWQPFDIHRPANYHAVIAR